jgi:hypothetical protein
MITFTTDFSPDGFEQSIIEPLKHSIRSKLAAAGLATLTVNIKKDPHGRLSLHLEGPDDEDLGKAKHVLNVR